LTFTHRVRQGLRAIFAFTVDVDYELAERYLDIDQMALFRRMAKSEQLHSLNVLRIVLEQNEQTPHDLAVAALLHDSGKSRKHLSVWQKTISVLVNQYFPQWDNKLSVDGELTFWRAPFIVRRHHPEWGADMLSELNSSERAIWLVRHHADSPDKWCDHPHYQLLLRLQAADDAN